RTVGAKGAVESLFGGSLKARWLGDAGGKDQNIGASGFCLNGVKRAGEVVGFCEVAGKFY
ncbi:hypothetical protein, partial [Cronobacter sakazakii]|uniref:hypothetical protein n=1 Tax=Cronobacter sakazakii TaxID=28141 RepID=UPI001958E510